MRDDVILWRSDAGPQELEHVLEELWRTINENLLLAFESPREETLEETGLGVKSK